MSTRALRTASAILIALGSIVVSGCNDRQVSPGQAAKIVKTKEDQALKDCETKVGLSFSMDTRLINSGDEGGRDPGYGFYEWDVFSPAAIKMPLLKVAGVREYLNLP